MSKKITLNQLQLKDSIYNTKFLSAYEKLISNKEQELTENEKFLLLKFAVIFLNYGEKELEKFGYRIILRYSNYFKDYQPLYDIALEKDYIPVAKFIEAQKFNSDEIEQSFYKLLMFSYKENFKHIQDNKTIYFSAGQKRIYNFSKNVADYGLVAPTSYGKSDIIIHKVEDNLNNNICIIVPTKSLLAQTRKNLIKNSKIRESRSRIITHPDMLNDISKNFIAVLTQERLLRLLQKHTSLKFDIVLIDEAHNLIENDPREILAIQDLKILNKRNSNTKFYYFTPFLVKPQDLKIFKGRDLLTDDIQEYIKVEKYLVCDLTSEKKLKIYDQFLNIYFDIEKNININNEFDFIKKYSANKNIIYINKPKSIEDFALSVNSEIEISEEVQKIQKALKEYLHQDYNLIKTLENGLVYHHGGMPENVRSYVENAFSRIEGIKYIATTSTLIQGVNIPAEKIFLLDTKKGRGNLNASQFKNLSGRICRFSEVFNVDKGDLAMLEPNIYLIKGKYSSKNANIEKFLMNRVKDNKVTEDEIENPLIKKNLTDLGEAETQQVKEAEEYQENIEPGTSEIEGVRVVDSKIAKACFRNNIHDFDIFENEKQLKENYENFRNINKISNANILISQIVNIFLGGITLKDSDNLKRLEEIPTQKFYAMFLEWRASGKSYNEMINNFLWYWKNKKTDPYIYVGISWGEITSPYKEGSGLLYIDLSKNTDGSIRSEKQKINIAIIRIKEEQDFVDFKLMPYVEILNDLQLMESNFYDNIKYGTSDPEMIKMLKEGFSIELAKAIKNGNYSEHISFSNDSMKVTKGIVEKMKENNENEILIFEIQYYTNE